MRSAFNIAVNNLGGRAYASYAYALPFLLRKPHSGNMKFAANTNTGKRTMRGADATEMGGPWRWKPACEISPAGAQLGWWFRHIQGAKEGCCQIARDLQLWLQRKLKRGRQSRQSRTGSASASQLTLRLYRNESQQHAFGRLDGARRRPALAGGGSARMKMGHGSTAQGDARQGSKARDPQTLTRSAAESFRPSFHAPGATQAPQPPRGHQIFWGATQSNT